jgi:hypothetical protein
MPDQAYIQARSLKGSSSAIAPRLFESLVRLFAAAVAEGEPVLSRRTKFQMTPERVAGSVPSDRWLPFAPDQPRGWLTISRDHGGANRGESEQARKSARSGSFAD